MILPKTAGNEDVIIDKTSFRLQWIFMDFIGSVFTGRLVDSIESTTVGGI